MTPRAAAAVLRRALLVWGGGHLALGERRGWLLVAFEIVAVVALALLATLLIEGTRWLVVLLGFVGFMLVWLGQAIDAHRRALMAGGAPGGEIQIAALLPIGLVLLGGFWLVGGALGSPGATLQRYVSAWQNDKPASAVGLLAQPTDPTALAVRWRTERAQLALLVGEAAQRYGAQAGLDGELPFNSLRFEELADLRGSGQSVVAVDLVRRERYQTELFGLIPTAAQRNVLVRRLGFVRLHAEPAAPPPWWPAGAANPSRVWRIAEVTLDLQP